MRTLFLVQYLQSPMLSSSIRQQTSAVYIYEIVFFNRDTFTEIRAVVKIGGQVVSAQTLSDIDVTSLRVNLRANNTFVSSTIVTSLALYSSRVQYSIALNQRILDVDIVNVSSQLAILYQTYGGKKRCINVNLLDFLIFNFFIF